MLSPRVPNLVPISGPRMERETPGQRLRPNYGHPQANRLKLADVCYHPDYQVSRRVGAGEDRDGAGPHGLEQQSPAIADSPSCPCKPPSLGASSCMLCLVLGSVQYAT